MQSPAFAMTTAQRPASRRLQSVRTIGALMLREIGIANGRSLLGYLWEIVEPVAGILILTVLFGLFLRSPPLGHNFALFYASGLLPYMIFTEATNRVAIAVRFSRPLLSYPGVTFLDAIIARFILVGMTKAVVMALVLSGILVVWSISPFFDYPRMMLAFAMAMMLALAVGMLNCLLMVFFPLYERLWLVLTRPLLLLSAVLYLFETVPLPYRDWLWWNPLVHIVGMMRSGIYPTYAADYASVTYVAILVAVMLPAALFFLRRYWREMLEMP